ncbi:hypothetical protein JCM13210_18950 [Thermaerobacter litoralis]
MTFRELIDSIVESVNPHVMYAIGISLIVSRKYFIVALILLVGSLLLTMAGLLHNEVDTIAFGCIFTIISVGLVFWTRRLPKKQKEDKV